MIFFTQKLAVTSKIISMEISNEELISIEKKNDENESQKLSDGEIVDDEDIKNSTINVPLQKKLQKNFRVRHSDHSDESDNDSLTFEKKSGNIKRTLKILTCIYIYNMYFMAFLQEKVLTNVQKNRES